VYNVQDLYPEVAVSTGAVRATAALRVLEQMMRLVYRGSAAVVVIDPFFVPVIERAEPRARCFAVRNAIDLAPFTGAERSDGYLASLGVPEGAQVVMYAGNVGRSQDLERVITATGQAGAHLVIHGAGAALGQLRRQVLMDALNHVHFSGYLDRQQLGAVFASADLHVVPLKPGIAGMSFPSKLLSIFAAGRPAVVAAEPGSPAARMVAETGAGWVVDPGDHDGLAVAIRSALSDPDQLAIMGRRGRDWAAREAGPDRAGREWTAVLEEVAAKVT